MNKKIIKYLLFIPLIVSFHSCKDYLETEKYFIDMLTTKEVFESKKYTEQWLYNVYGYLGTQEMGLKSNVAFSWASDEALFSDWDNLVERYQTGEFNPENQLRENRWNAMYEGIREASIFILNVDKCEELSITERTKYKAEARFLRAYYYWMLLKQYGPIPIWYENPADISKSYEELEIARSTMDECVEFITTEFLTAARVLPKEYQSNWVGKPTTGAALAIRAKVLLYAASPLYNGNTDYYNFKNNDGTNLINQKYSEEKWAKAAAAAKEVIDLGLYELNVVENADTDEERLPLAANVPTADYPDGAGNIDPKESYASVFNGEIPTSTNREMVFVRNSNSIEPMIRHGFPMELNGWNSNCVTLKQVDAYYMFDGKDINDPSAEIPYDDEKFTTSNGEVPGLRSGVNYQYAYREPRFYASIGFNGAVWPNHSSSDQSKKNYQCFYYKGTPNDNSDVFHYMLSGVGILKYVHPLDSYNEGGQRNHKVEPTIRYADVLLWYAEALNMLTKSYTFSNYRNQGNITVDRNVNELRYAISRIRFRAGLPDFDDALYNDSKSFYTALKRERQIELFLESARYFDLRRWKDAEVLENQPLMRLSVNEKEAQKEKFHKREPMPIDKKFDKKMYLWPIPLKELRMNGELVQNPWY